MGREADAVRGEEVSGLQQVDGLQERIVLEWDTVKQTSDKGRPEGRLTSLQRTV